MIERRNRIVVAMVSSFLKEMKLPSMFWGKAIRHSVCVLNRLPTRALTEESLYEAWMGNKPDISHLRVFGCVAYMKVPNITTTNLDDHSRMVVYLRREPGMKACRLYDPHTGMILVSKDFIFEEDKSWT